MLTDDGGRGRGADKDQSSDGLRTAPGHREQRHGPSLAAEDAGEHPKARWDTQFSRAEVSGVRHLAGGQRGAQGQQVPPKPFPQPPEGHVPFFMAISCPSRVQGEVNSHEAVAQRLALFWAWCRVWLQALGALTDQGRA